MPTHEQCKAKGARIRAKRDAAKLNQGQLGRMVGVSHAMISKYEKGESVFAMGARIESSLVKALRTNERWLNTGLGDDGPRGAMTERELEFVEILRALSDDKEQQLREYAEFLRSKEDSQPDDDS